MIYFLTKQALLVFVAAAMVNVQSQEITSNRNLLRGNSGNVEENGTQRRRLPGPNPYVDGCSTSCSSGSSGSSGGSSVSYSSHLLMAEYMSPFDEHNIASSITDTISLFQMPQWPHSVDWFVYQNQLYYNTIYEPAPLSTGPLTYVHLSTGSNYQTEFDNAVSSGLSPIEIKSMYWPDTQKIYYSGIFGKPGNGASSARHGLSETNFNAYLSSAAILGMSPTSISVVENKSGNLRYSAVFRSDLDVGDYEIYTEIKDSDYQSIFNSETALGRYPSSFDAYVKSNGQVYFAVVFSTKSQYGDWPSKMFHHNMKYDDLITKDQAYRAAGYKPLRVVTWK